MRQTDFTAWLGERGREPGSLMPVGAQTAQDGGDSQAERRVYLALLHVSVLYVEG